MPRTFPAAFEAERVKTGGAHIQRVLEIDHGGTIGTKYYAGSALTLGAATAEARVVAWGEMTIAAEPGQVGGYGTRSITLADADGALRQRFDSERPGVQKRSAKVWLWFGGTTWPTDAVVEFDGAIGDSATWDAASGCWNISLAGIEKATEDKTIGEALTRHNFPETACAGTEGRCLPVVYGDFCRRVPGVLIDKPGQGNTTSVVNVWDGSLTLNASGKDLGFTTGVPIQIMIGAAGNSEVLSGFFANDTTNVFTITGHGSVYAAGQLAGSAPPPGYTSLRYAVIDHDDLPDGAETPSFGGYPLLIEQPAGVWKIYMVQSWHDTGTGFATVPLGMDWPSAVDQNYLLLSWPGEVPVWPVGSVVREAAPWVFAVNHLPSEEIVRVEARADLQGSMGGQSQSVWYQYHPAYYSFSLDNPDWNDKLGRDSSDPGITTVSTNNPPHFFGFSDEEVFVTLRGITDNNRPSGDPIVNPIRVIQNLLTNPFIGEIDSGKLDTASFNAAAALVTQQCAFAITMEKPLHQTCAELAQQCGCVYGWDGGKAVVMRLPDGEGTSVFTADESVIARQGENGPPALSYEMLPAKDICTELIAKFKMACEGPERRIARRSVEAVDELGRTVREFNAWAYQFASSVVLAVEQRLAWMLNRQRRVTFTAFLTAYHLRPGDVITVSLSNGTATYFGPVTAVVTSVKSVAADAESGQMETVEVSALCWTWDYTVTDLPDGLDSCLGDYPPEFGATGTPPGAVSSGVGISFGGYMSPWGPGGDWAPEPGEPGGESGGSGGESGGSGSGGSDSGGSDSGGSEDPSGVDPGSSSEPGGSGSGGTGGSGGSGGTGGSGGSGSGSGSGGGSTSASDEKVLCCDGVTEISKTLHAELESICDGVDVGCPGSSTLTWNDVGGYWEGPYPKPSYIADGWTLRVWCDGSQMKWSQYENGVQALTPQNVDSLSCNPFEATILYYEGGALLCCGGIEQVSITITEAP